MMVLKSPEEIDKLAQVCLIVAKTIKAAEKMVRTGLTTLEIENFADDFIRLHGGLPAFKGYRGYPASICTSVNNEVIHGIPSKRVLKEGDILGIDLGVYKDGFYGVGEVSVRVGGVGPDL